MATDLQAEVQRLARLLQSGEITREDFKAQTQELRQRAGAALSQAAAGRARPVQVQQRSSPIVESGPDVRAGVRNFSLILALLAIGGIALGAWAAARDGADAWRLPSFDMDQVRPPRRLDPPPPPSPEPQAPNAGRSSDESAASVGDPPPKPEPKP